jgi:hypothetical protein
MNLRLALALVVLGWFFLVGAESFLIWLFELQPAALALLR